MQARKLRMGMIGGGTDSFIGGVHRRAAIMENEIELVCGCFSVNPQTSLASGRKFYIPDERIYTTWEEMMDKESKLPEGERMDFVTIVTPNKYHYAPAMRALELGFNVVIEKPMTFSLEEAISLSKKVHETGLTLALMHAYAAYPAIKEAKARIAHGDIGRVRRVYVEYSQGWLTERVELKGVANAVWRSDPAMAGKGGCVGDIGTHAWHLAEYVTGAKVTHLCADLLHVADGRPVDDDASAFLRFDRGFTGLLHASQVAAGEENNIHLRVYGEKGSIDWRRRDPNTLYMRWIDRPVEELRMGNDYQYLMPGTKYYTRLPGGHGEGFIESFANIYRNFARTVRSKMAGIEPHPEWLDFPTVDDGVRGMQFIETMVAAGHDDNNKWHEWVYE